MCDLISEMNGRKDEETKFQVQTEDGRSKSYMKQTTEERMTILTCDQLGAVSGSDEDEDEDGRKQYVVIVCSMIPLGNKSRPLMLSISIISRLFYKTSHPAALWYHAS